MKTALAGILKRADRLTFEGRTSYLKSQLKQQAEKLEKYSRLRAETEHTILGIKNKIRECENKEDRTRRDKEVVK